MKYFIIYNPGAKSGVNKHQLTSIITWFKNHRLTYDYAVTGCLEDAYRASAAANRQGYDRIIAVGGDGTINRVLNGFYDSQGNRVSQSVLGIIHTGTSPDFCKSYAIPTRIAEALNTILTGKTRLIRLGKITMADSFQPELHDQPIAAKNTCTIRYFACCANIGLGAALARYANQGIRKYMGDFLGTLLSLIRVLMQYKAYTHTIVIDDRKICIEHMFNMSIGKTYYIASGIRIKNGLQETDDRFYLFTVKNLSLGKIPLCLRTVYSGNTIKNSDNFTLHYGKNIEIYGNRYHPEVEFDGDPAGFLPCRIETAKDPLEIFTLENRKTEARLVIPADAGIS